MSKLSRTVRIVTNPQTKQVMGFALVIQKPEGDSLVFTSTLPDLATWCLWMPEMQSALIRVGELLDEVTKAGGATSLDPSNMTMQQVMVLMSKKEEIIRTVTAAVALNTGVAQQSIKLAQEASKLDGVSEHGIVTPPKKIVVAKG